MTPQRRENGDGTLLGDLRAMPRPFWILLTGSFINRFGSFVLPFLALYLRKEGYTLGQAGVAIGAYGAGGLLAGILGGYLADRIGRRNTIAYATLGSAVFVLTLYFARGLPWTIAAAFATGVFNGMYHPASSALLADIVPVSLRVRGYAGMRFAINAGFAFGMAAAGFMAKFSYLWLFVGDAATTAAFGVIAWLRLPHGLRTRKAEARWSPALESIRGNRRFIGVLCASFAIAVIFWQTSSTFALHVVDVGYSTSVFGLLMSLNGVMIIFLELPLTTITQRLRPRRVMALGYVILGAGLSLNAFSSSLAILILSMVVLTIGEMISLPVASAYVAKIAPDRMRGRYMGILGLSWTGATMLGPGFGMRLYALNPTLVWLACGALGVAAAGLLLLVSGNPVEEREGGLEASLATPPEPS